MEALRQIVAKFKADLTPLDEGLEKSEKKVGGFEKTLKNLGAQIIAAFAVKSIYDFTFGLVHSADATAKMADALGLGIVELQEWTHAADLAGVAGEQVTMSITKLGQKIAQAKDGNAELAKTFKGLGVDMDELSAIADQSLGDAFEHVGLALAGVENDAKRTDLAMKLFEESGPKLFNLFKGGAKSIEEARKEIHELGAVIDEDFARGAEAFDDNIDRLQKGFKGLVIQGLGPILPDLIDLTEYMVRGAKAVIPMVRGFVRFTRESKALQAVLSVLSLKGIGVVAKALGGWLAKMGGLRGILMRVIPLLWKFIAPMLILEDLFVFLAGGDSAIGEALVAIGKKLGLAFNTDDVREFITAFRNAPEKIQAAFADLPKDLERTFGIIGKLAGLAGQGIIESFLLATAIITGDWESASGKIETTLDHTTGVIGFIFESMKFGVLGVAASISDGFTNTWNAIIGGAQDAIRAIASVMSKIPGLGDAAGELRKLAGSVGGLKGEANASEGVEAERQSAMNLLAAIANEAGRSPGAVATASRSQVNNNVQQSVTNKNTVQVTVPAGTSGSVARGVGAAASRSFYDINRDNNRATLDALTPTPAYYVP